MKTKRAMNGSGKRDAEWILREKRAALLSGPNLDVLVSNAENPSMEVRAPASHDQFIALQLNRIVMLNLTLIDDALERFNAGVYGICAECGEQIHPRRLKAVPWAERCVDCEGSRSKTLVGLDLYIETAVEMASTRRQRVTTRGRVDRAWSSDGPSPSAERRQA